MRSVAEGDWTASRAPAPATGLAPAGAAQGGAAPVGEAVASQALAWQALIDGAAPVQVPAHTRWQVIFDLEQYYCAYPQLTVSAGLGAVLTLGWAEALYIDAEGHVKGQRDEVAGRYFLAPTRTSFCPTAARIAAGAACGGGPDATWSYWWRPATSR